MATYHSQSQFQSQTVVNILRQHRQLRREELLRRPAGVTIIAVFQLVQAAVLLVALFIAIRNPAPDSSIQLGVGRQLIPTVEVEDISIAPIVAGVLIVLSVGLLWLREWARLVTILFAVIPVARFVIGFALVALIRPSRLSAGLNANLRVGLLFDLAILWYLLRDEVKKEFRALP